MDQELKIELVEIKDRLQAIQIKLIEMDVAGSGFLEKVREFWVDRYKQEPPF